MATETVNITTTLADDSVTNAKLAEMNARTIKLRATGAGLGNPIDGSPDQASEILDLATDPFVRTSVLPTVVEEDPGPGVGLIESGAGVSPIVLKNAKNGTGTEAVNNTGSFQYNVKFTGANQYHYGDISGNAVEGTITSAGRDLLDDANAAAQRTTLGLGTAATANTGDFDAAGAAAAAQAASQPLDSDLTAIAGLTPSNDDVIQRKAGAWTNRSLAQLLSDFLFTTIGLAYARLTNPSAVTFPRQNADNTVTSRTAAELRTDLGLGTAAQVDTGTGAANVPTITQADARYTQIGYAPAQYSIAPVGQAAVLQWTNMPAALTFFLGQSRWFVMADLTNRTQIRLAGGVFNSAGSASAKLRILYRTQAAGYDLTISNYSTIGTSEVQMTLGTTVNTVVESGWIDIVAGAKGKVLIALAGIDGDGVADPAFTGIWVEVK